MLYSCCCKKITSFLCLQERLDKLYAEKLEGDFLDGRRYDLQKILESVEMPCEEICKYGKYSPQIELPYTRNCVHENEHYSILVLAWKPGAESKIHNHPCDGCLILPLHGSLTETVYERKNDSTYNQSADTDFLKLKSVTNFKKGEVGFMSDGLGQYHKIGSKQGCISLHLYTPPFSKCKIWVQDKANAAQDDQYKTVDVGMKFYSVRGCVQPAETQFDLDHYL